MNEYKRVLHIMNSLLPSGAETMLKVSANEWEGYEKHILATFEEVGEYAKTLEEAGYNIHHIYDNNNNKHHKKIRELIKEIKPDVVHIHCESNFLKYVMDAKKSGVKSITRTVHNVFKYGKRMHLKQCLYRYIARKMNVNFVAIGNSVYENEEKVFYNKCRYIINNWCNENEYKYISNEEKAKNKNMNKVDQDAFCIVSVGNCNYAKNHTYIFRAIKKISDEFNLINEDGKVLLYYYHVGSGDLESEERKEVKNMQIEEYVKFCGKQNPLKYYQMCDLFVMPSIFEGLGISALEAMNCGIPILITDVPGLKDFKQIECKNIVFTSLNEEEYYLSLKRLYVAFKNNELNNCREENILTREVYNMKKSVQKYMMVYENLEF